MSSAASTGFGSAKKRRHHSSLLPPPSSTQESSSSSSCADEENDRRRHRDRSGKEKSKTKAGDRPRSAQPPHGSSISSLGESPVLLSSQRGDHRDVAGSSSSLAWTRPPKAKKGGGGRASRHEEEGRRKHHHALGNEQNVENARRIEEKRSPARGDKIDCDDGDDDDDDHDPTTTKDFGGASSSQLSFASDLSPPSGFLLWGNATTTAKNIKDDRPRTSSSQEHQHQQHTSSSSFSAGKKTMMTKKRHRITTPIQPGASLGMHPPDDGSRPSHHRSRSEMAAEAAPQEARGSMKEAAAAGRPSPRPCGGGNATGHGHGRPRHRHHHHHGGTNTSGRAKWGSAIPSTHNSTNAHRGPSLSSSFTSKWTASASGMTNKDGAARRAGSASMSSSSGSGSSSASDSASSNPVPSPHSTRPPPRQGQTQAKERWKDYADNDDDDSDDMETPYTQNLGFDAAAPKRRVGAGHSTGGGNTHNDLQKGKEPLNPGDVIMYTHPMFVVGAGGGKGRVPMGLRVAQVWAVEPRPPTIASNRVGSDDDDDDEDYFPLELSNGELLPNDHMVQRLKEYRKGQLRHHRGVYRPIDHFRLRQSTLSADARAQFAAAHGEGGAAADGSTKADRLMSVLDSFRDEAFRALRSDSPVANSGVDDADAGASEIDDGDDTNSNHSKELTTSRPRTTTTRGSDNASSSTSASESSPESKKAPARSSSKSSPSSSSSSSSSSASDAESVLVERRKSVQEASVPQQRSTLSSVRGSAATALQATNPNTARREAPATRTASNGATWLTKCNSQSRSHPPKPKTALSASASENGLLGDDTRRHAVRFEGTLGANCKPTAPNSATTRRPSQRAGHSDDSDDDALPPSSGMGCSPSRRSSTSDSFCGTPAILQRATLATPKGTAASAAAEVVAATTVVAPSRRTSSPKTAQSTSTSSSSLGGGLQRRNTVHKDDLFDFDSDDDVLQPPKRPVARGADDAKSSASNFNLTKARKRSTKSKRSRSVFQDLDSPPKRTKSGGSVSSAQSSHRSFYRPSGIEKTSARGGTAKRGHTPSSLEFTSDDEDSGGCKSSFLKLPPIPSGSASVASSVQSFGSQRRQLPPPPSGSSSKRDATSTRKSPKQQWPGKRPAPSASPWMTLSFQRASKSSSLEF